MKLIKLSLITALSVGALVAQETTVSGKLTAYHYTDDLTESMFADQQQLGLGATLDVTHTFTEGVSANFTALGYRNTFNGDDNTLKNFYEGTYQGAIFNVANLTATFEDTTLVLGRQLLGTPMLQGYDWLFAPGSFEAYTAVNSSISNLALVGTYVNRVRGNNSGEFGGTLKDNNFAFGASYDDKTFTGNAWFYNIDAADYTQVYVDGGYTLYGVNVQGQYVMTAYGEGDDAMAFGISASASVANIDVSFGFNHLADRATGYVGWNGLYTNQWNSSVADQFKGDSINAFKIQAATTLMGVSADVSYASYDNDRYEANVIVGYDINDAIDAGIVYSNYESTVTGDETSNQLEIYANYKF